MADIKTITQELWSGSNDSNFQAASGSYEEEKSYLEDHEANCEVKTTYLLKQKRIKKIVDKELKKIMDSVGLDEEFLMTNLFDIISNADKYGDKKAAIEMACKLRGMFPKEKQTGALAVMQEVRGFTREEIDSFNEPSLEIPVPKENNDDNRLE